MTELHFSKVPPQSIDTEESLLGAVINESDAISKVIDFITPEMFYKNEHQIIFTACLELFQSGGKIDLITIAEQLRKSGQLETIGGVYALTMLSSKIYSSAHIIQWAMIIVEKYISRKTIEICTSGITQSYDALGDIGVLNDTVIQDLIELQSLFKIQAEQTIEQIASKKDEIVTDSIKGNWKLYEKTGGWFAGDFIIIASRPSEGKTSFCLGIAKEIASFDYPVLILSLEMTSNSLYKRFLSVTAQVNGEKIRDNQLNALEREKLIKAENELKQLPIIIDDDGKLNPITLRGKVTRMIAKYGIRLVIIDYIQLMTAKANSREERIGACSKGIKSLCKEFKIPVIALSQLTRNKDRGKNGYSLEDLRHSGALEEDADVVIFINRPEYHGMDVDNEGISTKNKAEIHIAKNRNGSIGKIEMQFIAEHTLFQDYEEVPF